MTNREIKRIEETLNKLEGGFINRGLSLFRGVSGELEPQISRMFRQGKLDRKSFSLPGRKRYLSLFERFFFEIYSQGVNLAEKEVNAKRKRYAQFDDDDYIPAPMLPSLVTITEEGVIPRAAVKWMDEWIDVFGNEYYNDLTSDVVNVIQKALKEGYEVKSVMSALEVYLSGPHFNKRRLETIARTNATTAFTQGRLDLFREDPEFVVAVEFLAILDSRVTDICRSRHGKVMRMDSPELAENTPPLHYKCRSMLSPITKYEWNDLILNPEFAARIEWKALPPPDKVFGDILQRRIKK